MTHEDRRVLIVDDQPANRKLLTSLVRHQGYVAVGAAGGQEALALIASEHFDLVLLDMMMPDLDGMGVLRELRRRQLVPGLAVVIITAFDDNDIRIRALESGAVDFLTKPVNRLELAAKCRTFIELAALREQVAVLAEQRGASDFSNKAETALSNLPLVLYGRGGSFLEPTTAWCLGQTQEILGLTHDQFCAQLNPHEFAIPRDRELIESRLQAAAETGTNVISERFRINPDSTTERWVFHTCHLDNDQQPVAGALLDISDRAKLEDDLAEVQRLFELAPDALVIGSERFFTSTNPAWRTLTGWSESESHGRPFFDFIHPDDQQSFISEAAKATVAAPLSLTVRIIKKNGDLSWMALKGVGDWHGFYGTGRDVTAQRLAEERLLEVQWRIRSIVANAPNGISIRNREHNYELVNQAFCDLFGLVDPGKALGQKEDVLLPAEVLSKMRDADMRALSGESTRFEHETTVNGRQLTIDAQVFPVDSGQGQITGIGMISTDITDRKRVESQLRERLEFEEFISRAINDGRLLVYSQPIVDARTAQLIEEELLVRLVGPDDELVAPDSFLPQAHRFGMMPSIDKYMVARAIELAQAGRHVAVNLSADSICDPSTMDEITDAITNAGDLDGRISFEITEHAALASINIAEHFSDDMRRLGCPLALDDFGTGFGTFTELRRIALHSLKIDISFVQGLLTNNRDESVVKMIISIAREFGLVTTAEGVEDAETLARLVELGVDQAQGYLIARPALATTRAAVLAPICDG